MDSKIWYIATKNDRLEKKVGIYCRVSTNEKEQLYSLAAVRNIVPKRND